MRPLCDRYLGSTHPFEGAWMRRYRQWLLVTNCISRSYRQVPNYAPQSTVASSHDTSTSLHTHKKLPVMSTESADSDSEVHGRGQQSPLASQRAAEQNPRKSRLDGMFPLGYKQGFSQWWSALPAAQAEHKVLSYIPYLQTPPTHTQTGSEPPSVNPSSTSLNKTSGSTASFHTSASKL